MNGILLKQAVFTMKWKKEPNSINNRSAWRAHTEKADYFIVPAHGGFRLHSKAHGSDTWVCDSEPMQLRVAKELAEWVDAER